MRFDDLKGWLHWQQTLHPAAIELGLERVAAACHANTNKLWKMLCEIQGVQPLFDRPVFHEKALRLPIPARDLLRSLAAHNVLGGLDLGLEYPELDPALLVCATEMRTDEEIESFARKLERVIATRTGPGCPVKPKL